MYEFLTPWGNCELSAPKCVNHNYRAGAKEVQREGNRRSGGAGKDSTGLYKEAEIFQRNWKTDFRDRRNINEKVEAWLNESLGQDQIVAALPCCRAPSPEPAFQCLPCPLYPRALISLLSFHPHLQWFPKSLSRVSKGPCFPQVQLPVGWKLDF